MRLFAVFFLALLLGSSQLAFAKEECPQTYGTQMTGAPDTPFNVAIDFGSNAVPLSAPFGAAVTICPTNAAQPDRVKVDATMPAHKHGMNYEPSVKQIETGRFEIRDLLFHMPGTWRFEITAYLDGKPHRFFHNVNVQ